MFRGFAVLAAFSLACAGLQSAYSGLYPSNAGALPQVAGLSGGGAGIVMADSNDAERKKLESQQAAAKQREAELSRQLEGVKSELANLTIALERTKSAIPVAQTKLSAATTKLGQARRHHEMIQASLKVAQSQKARLQQEIAAGEAAIEKSEVAIGQIAREAYRGGKLGNSPWSLLLEADSLEDLATRVQVAQTAAQSQNRVIQAAQEATSANINAKTRQEAVTVRIGELEVEAQAAVQAANQAKIEQENQLKEIKSLQAQQVNQKNQLDARKSDFEQDIREQQAAQAEAARKIAEMVAASRNGPSRTVTGGIFGAPLSTLNRTSPYGYRLHPILHRRILHAGTDFGIACGTPIFAAQSGTVRLDQNGIGGNVIFLNHGMINGVSWQTAYAHLSAYRVSPGQQVAKGQVIGLVGSTGRSTGCHLHFEVWKNGSTIDSYAALMG